MNSRIDSSGSRPCAAADAIRRRWSGTPRTGIILGTGLGKLTDEIETETKTILPFADIPGFPCSTALGHVGRLVCGRIDQTTTIVMDGRCHLYEGYSVEQIALPVKVFADLGVDRLIITNAAGGLNPKFRSGDVMVLEDHLDLTWKGSLSSGAAVAVGRCGRQVNRYYDEDGIRRALAMARRHGVPAQRGVYAALTGPNYETRAEYRMLRRLGADAVGMSTIPEAVQAAQLGMRVLAFSVITNVATPDCPNKVSADQVVADARRAEGRLRDIIRALLR